MENARKTHRILGVDPGTNIMGYAVIEVQLRPTKLRLIDIDVLHMKNEPEAYMKLKHIFDQIQKIILEHKPDVMAIEAPFFGKNVQSMLKLGRAQGVAIAAAMARGIEVIEYSPKKIKQSVTGNGNASKEQVAAMLSTIMQEPLTEQYADATDALATAVCHHFQGNSSGVGATKKYSSWEQFAKDKQDRIK